MQVTKEGDGEEMMPPEEDEEGGDGENCKEADEEMEEGGGSELGGGSMKVRQMLINTDEGLDNFFAGQQGWECSYEYEGWW